MKNSQQLSLIEMSIAMGSSEVSSIRQTANQGMNSKPVESTTALIIIFTILLIVPPFIAAYITFRRSSTYMRHGSRARRSSYVLPLREKNDVRSKSVRQNFSRPLQSGTVHWTRNANDCLGTKTANAVAYCNVMPSSPICPTGASLNNNHQFSSLDPRNHWRTSHPFRDGSKNSHDSMYMQNEETIDDVEATPETEAEIGRAIPARPRPAKIVPSAGLATMKQHVMSLRQDDTSKYYCTMRYKDEYQHKIGSTAEVTLLSPVPESPITSSHPLVGPHAVPTLTKSLDCQKMSGSLAEQLLSHAASTTLQRPAVALVSAASDHTKVVYLQAMAENDNHAPCLGTARMARISHSAVKLLTVRNRRYDLNNDRGGVSISGASAHQSMTAEWECIGKGHETC